MPKKSQNRPRNQSQNRHLRVVGVSEFDYSKGLPFDYAVEEFFKYKRVEGASANTIAAYTRDLQQIGDELAQLHGLTSPATLDLTEVTVHDLRNAFDRYLQTHEATSAQRVHACWSKFFRVLVEDDYLTASPMAGVPRPKTKPRIPKPLKSDDALEKILTAALNPPPRDRSAWAARDLALLLLMGGSGLRSGETLTLRVNDLMDSPDGWLLRVHGKGGKDRMAPLPGGIADRLHAYLGEWSTVLGRDPSPTDMLFLSRKGEPMTKGQLEHRFERIVTTAGVSAAFDKGAALHALRHTFATRAIQDGVPVSRLQILMGHEAVTTTQLYVKISDAELRAEVEGSRAARLTEGLGT